MMQYWNLASKTYRFGTLESFNRYESALGCICKSDSFGTEMRAGEKIRVIKRLLLTKVQYSDLHAARKFVLFSHCTVCHFVPV